MKIFSNQFLSELTDQAKASPRRRLHHNIHRNYEEPCQRLFNAIEPGSYIRPHRHASDPRDEMLIAVRGLMAVITFDNEGAVEHVIRLGTELYGPDACSAVEVSCLTWHTVIALEPGSVLMEIKAGPFDPNQPKDLAPWAPAESSADARAYMDQLIYCA